MSLNNLRGGVDFIKNKFSYPVNILFFGLLIFLNYVTSVSAQQIEDLTAILANVSEMNDEEKASLLSSFGGSALSNFSWTNLIIGFIFGSVGLIAFIYGKKQKSFKPLVIGLGLMVYPYFIYNTFWLCAVGISLCCLLYYWRD